MYESYFGMTEAPFALTPNTKFFYMSEPHEAAMRTLLYGVERGSGFMMLCGEVGAGKTTTVRALLNLLKDRVETSLILNPLLSTLDLIKCINADFGNACASDSVQDQLKHLNDFLLMLNSYGKTALVVIEEAQNLTFEAFEMTRMLSNLETESHKLITILLVGQPELQKKIAQRDLRQLAQRIQVNVQLSSLDLEQTGLYIRHRVNCAGDKAVAYFDDAAIKKIYKCSHGIPRLINNICDLGLLAAYSENTRVVDAKIIVRALREVPRYVYHS
jgi:general secretion pathway protein A